MTQDNSETLPEVKVQNKSGFSIIWLIPLIAAGIGGWLAFKTISEKGPTITIKFKNGAGLEPEKTKVKYRAVEMGVVNHVTFSRDLSHVLVTATLNKDAEAHLTEDSKFWVVRPRISATNITGLDTLVSGSYIEFEPGSGEPKKEFVALEQPPVIKLNEPGRKFLLKSESLGSLNAGSPVYFREINVGNVLGYEMAKDKKSVNLHIFIKAPHDQLIKPNTKFWNLSGIDFSMDADGIRVKTQSLEALIGGGIAFESPLTAEKAKPVKEDSIFKLYKSYEATRETFSKQELFIMYFEGSVRGLKVGAPVEFRGIRVGTVKDITMEVNRSTIAVRIPVIIALEPERIKRIGRESSQQQTVPLFIKRGLKARVQTGSLLTGQLFVEFDFFPDTPIKLVGGDSEYIEIPTVPSTLDEVTESATEILADIKNLPLEELVVNLIDTVQGVNRLLRSDQLMESVKTLNTSLQGFQQLTDNLNAKLDIVTNEISETTLIVRQTLEQSQTSIVKAESQFEETLSTAGSDLHGTLKDIRGLVKEVNDKVEPITSNLIGTLDKTKAALTQGQKTLSTADENIAVGSPLRYELDNTLQEISSAARSIRILSDYLARHPDALLYGKTGVGSR
jgi:paraquat-inducible protein B